MNEYLDAMLTQLTRFTQSASFEKTVESVSHSTLFWLLLAFAVFLIQKRAFRFNRRSQKIWCVSDRRKKTCACDHIDSERPLLPTYKKPFMTGNEREFFVRLTNALPDYYVYPQVSFSAFLETPKEDRWRYDARGRYNRLFADYIVCNRATFDIVAVIELDDKFHDTPERRTKDEKRDAMLDEAGYLILRFRSKSKPSETQITELFAGLRKA